MELPEPRERFLVALKIAVTAICAVVTIMFLCWTAEWQNSIRQLMQLKPVTSAHPFEVCLIAIVTFLVLIALARLFKRISRLISERSGRFVPRKVSKVIGFAVAILLFWAIANGVLVRYALHVVDSSFAAFDALIEPDRVQPTAPLKTGSAASLVSWEELGRAGTGVHRDRTYRCRDKHVHADEMHSNRSGSMSGFGRPTPRTRGRNSPSKN